VRENRTHGSVGGGESPLPNRTSSALVGSAVRTERGQKSVKQFLITHETQPLRSPVSWITPKK